MRPDPTLREVPGGAAPLRLNPRVRRARAEPPDPDALWAALRAGDPLALARAITLTESRRPKDRQAAETLLELARPHAGKGIRVGITGVPGVGKSTLIEVLGLHVVRDRGERLAVLAVDPSSVRTKGSILGDKARMPRLAAEPNAFIRPSPSGGTLGGVTRVTREAIVLCEAAGHTVVFVETVGVGQSEIAVHGMVDAFVLLLLPGAGDEMQGIKRGIVEMADLFAITKADGDNRARAEIARQAYANALHLFPPSPTGWTPRVLTCSALTGEGIEALWDEVLAFVSFLREKGHFDERRAEQTRAWFYEELHRALYDAVVEHPRIRPLLERLEKEVVSGPTTPSRAVARVLAALRSLPFPEAL